MDAAPQSSNRILAKLPYADFEWLRRQAEPVHLEPGEIVCDPGRPLAYAYFPSGGILSSVVVLDDGFIVEAAAIGNEGMAGAALGVDGAAHPHRIVQQIRGEMLRVPAAVFRAALAVSQPLHELTDRYMLALLQQCGQNAACVAHHDVKQRMCRWLLSSSDRVGSDEFELTQEYLAQMLGVRRQSVGLAAQLLQEAGWISYSRGRLTIRDRHALEQAACECYETTQQSYDRVMQMG